MFMRFAQACRARRPRNEKEETADTLLAEIGGDLLASLNQTLHGLCRLVEHAALHTVELDLDDALDSLAADDDGHADIKILHAVLAVEPGRRRQHAFLVAQITFRHGDRR